MHEQVVRHGTEMGTPQPGNKRSAQQSPRIQPSLHAALALRASEASAKEAVRRMRAVVRAGQIQSQPAEVLLSDVQSETEGTAHAPSVIPPIAEDCLRIAQGRPYASAAPLFDGLPASMA